MPGNNLCYLASPYSKCPRGTEWAFREVCKKAAELMESGLEVFCPIAHSHPIEKYGMMGHRQPGDWWLKQDFAILKHCSMMYVYMMPGWQTSEGVLKEIQFAADNNIPVCYLAFNEEIDTDGFGL